MTEKIKPDKGAIGVYYSKSERIVLGCIVLRGSDLFESVHRILPKPEMFYFPDHQNLYRVMVLLAKEGKQIDWVSLENKGVNLERVKAKMQGIGKYVEGRAETHAKFILDAYWKRKIQEGLEKDENLEKIMMEASLSIKQREADRFFTPKESAMQVIEDWGKEEKGLSYPFKLIQAATTGLKKGEVTIVAARPAVGKSAFLGNVALHLAGKGKRILFATAEMSSVSLAKRFVSSLAMVNLFYKDDVDKKGEQAVHQAIDKFASLDIYIYEFYSLGQLEKTIQSKIEGVDLLLVDYLQMIEPKAKYRSLYERTTGVTNELRQMAVKYSLPVMAACQYNRDAEGCQPSLAHLRQSGEIEQDANVVISLWRKDKDESDPERQKVRIDMLKNRNGFTFFNSKKKEYSMWFFKKVFKFFEMSRKGEKEK